MNNIAHQFSYIVDHVFLNKQHTLHLNQNNV